MIKLTTWLRRGYNHQRAGNQTCYAVRRRILHSKLSGTFALRSKRRRTAAVQIEHGYTSQTNHCVSDLGHRHASGGRRLTAVIDKQHNRTVRLDADRRSRIAFNRIGILTGDNILAILDENGAAAHRLDNIAADWRGCAANFCCTIVQDRKIVISRIRAVINGSIHNQRAIRRTGRHVVKIRIDDTDNICIAVRLLQLLFCCRCLIRTVLHTPGSTVIILISRFYADIRI